MKGCTVDKNKKVGAYGDSAILNKAMEELGIACKTLNNSTAIGEMDQGKDIEFWGEGWGDGDTFKLIAKASSRSEGWMKSTKAMEIPGVGCVIQVTTQQGDNVAEALTFVPGVKTDDLMRGSKVVGRRIVKI